MTTATNHRAKPCPIGTYGYHAILTHKQADVLSYLYCDGFSEGPVSCTLIASDFHDLQSEDIAAGYPVHYAPPSYSSVYATLCTLERRGLLQRVAETINGYATGHVLWDLTPSGVDAARRYC